MQVSSKGFKKNSQGFEFLSKFLEWNLDGWFFEGSDENEAAIFGLQLTLTCIQAV